MFCTQCGTDISEKDKFCPACGKPSSAPAAPPQQSYTPPPPPPPPVQHYAPPPPPPPPQAPVYQEPPRYAPPPPPPPPPVYSQPPPAYPQAPAYPQQQPGYPPPPPYGAPAPYGAPPYGAPGYQMEASGNSKLYAALAYLVPVIGPILAIMQGKGDKFVLFHGWQAAIYDGVIVVLWIISYILMRISYMLGIIFDLAIFGVGILALIAFIQALMGKIFKIPVIGQFAARMSGS